MSSQGSPLSKFKPSEASVARRNTLQSILLSVKPGDTISYGEISRQAGFSVRDYSSQLSYVKSRLIKNQKVVFGLVWGNGLIRLTSSGILLLAESKEDSLRRRSSKSIHILTSINRNELSDAEKVRFDQMIKKAGFIYAALCDDSAAERLAGQVHYPKYGPEIGPALKAIFGSERRKLSIAAPKPAA